MRPFGILLCLSLTYTFASGDRHMHAHGPLGTIHENLEAPSPQGCDRRKGFSISKLTLMPLNVSATFYNSTQIINITWTPQPNVCNDDYIGAFFIEIPVVRRKIRFIYCTLIIHNAFFSMSLP